ncbi:hypothetical protein RchiOBHm_Chr3g0470781 [Rosa chinensis]|uniref:Uncharacterized protein n=1 Tax=Rosa chinensis TaxID=74649 RepID=A0A2P6RB65_ROSCH|nr:uncharacterized protein LOC121052022 [Rosa chinensis]PRQ43654.1 hypothetical protein RchiOBHm_Chr3g0470781 [Rosa chinensis]
MPPTPARASGELTAKQKAAVNMIMTATLLVICVSLRRFVVPLSKGNFLLRELALFWFISTIMLIPINLFTFVVFVYHFHGENIRRTIAFFRLWGALSFSLRYLI